MNKKRKKEEFLKLLHEIYNDKNINLSKRTREEILKQYRNLEDNKTNINYASLHLYPLIRDDRYNNDSEKLDKFLELILKYRWKTYFGMTFRV